MHPPGPENGEARDLAGCSRLSEKQNSNDNRTVARNASQANLFSPAELFCQRHGITYRKGSFPGEAVITCLTCGHGKMFVYQTWALCLACGHYSESFASLEQLLKVRTP